MRAPVFRDMYPRLFGCRKQSMIGLARIIVFVPIALLIQGNSVRAQACGAQYTKLEVAQLGECNYGNPKYVVTNSGAPTVIKYCTEKQEADGTSSRSFTDLTVPTGETIILGCQFEYGPKSEQRFTIQWEAGPPCKPPQNITIASDALEIVQLNAGYGIKNHHHFKTVQVTYTYQGSQKTDKIKYEDLLSLLDFSDQPPVIQVVSYLAPYNLSSPICLTPLDQYPPPP